MRRFTRAFCLHTHAFPKRSLPPASAFSSLASSPEAATVCVGTLETRKSTLRKARNLKTDKSGSGSLHADISTSIGEKSRLTIKSKKAKANVAEAAAMLAKSEDAYVHDNEATQEANALVFHDKYVFETGKVFPNEAVERSGEIKTVEEPSNGMVQAKEELVEWASKLDMKSFKSGDRWMETACKLLDYGISSAHVKSMLQKCRALSCGRQVDSALENFAMLGMTHEKMGSIISRWPSILNLSENSFRSRVEFFESVGIDKRALGKMMHRAHWVMAVSCRVLRERYDFWDNYFRDVGKNAVRTVVSRDPILLASNVQKTVKSNLAYLEALGLSIDKKLLLKKPTVLNNSVKTLALKLKVLEEFGASDARSLTIAFIKLQDRSIVTMQERLHNLFMLGFSFEQVKIMMITCPQVLVYTEDRSNLRVNYAVSVMKISLDVLAACAKFWDSNFERRIKFRLEMLQKLRDRGISAKNYSLAYILTMCDAEFSTKFEGKFKQSLLQSVP